MKKLIILFVGCLISVKLSAQLSGTAFMSGQTNHSGIKIKFLSNGGTAVTDSTITNSVGNFSINITGGSYKIIYTKSGYLDINYNGGSVVILTNTVALNSQTLSPGNQVIVTGNVSGQWTNNNTYIVNGNLTIPIGQTLTIQPGTNIRFNGTYSITANGILNATGNSSSPIIFTSNMTSPAPADWKGIFIYNAGSVVKYCLFDYCESGVWMFNYSAIIANNEIRNFNYIAIYGENSSSEVNNNWIHEYNSSIYSQGISWSSGTPTIECNVIHDGGGYGIRAYSGLVRNNDIYNILGSTRGFGMEFSYGMPKVQNNYIHNCNTGMKIGSNVTPIPDPTIINNTITNNLYNGIEFINFYAKGTLINNIIASNGVGIYQAVPGCTPMCSTTPSIVSNNLVWNNSMGNYSDVQITGVGQIVSTNPNGDAVDPYFNLSQDPLFSNAPSLSANSPCFNAGMASHSNNIGFDPLNGCNAGVNSVKKINLLNNLMSVYPNPSNGEIIISMSDLNTNCEIEVLNALGQNVFQIKIAEAKTKLDITDFPKGIYFFIAKENNTVVSNKKIVLE